MECEIKNLREEVDWLLKNSNKNYNTNFSLIKLDSMELVIVHDSKEEYITYNLKCVGLIGHKKIIEDVKNIIEECKEIIKKEIINSC